MASVGAQTSYTDTTSTDDTQLLSSDCQTYSFSSPGNLPTTTTPTAPVGQPPAPLPTAPPPGNCGGADAVVVALDKRGEVVTLSASGNLTGWKLVSATGNQTFNFPGGFVATGTVQVKSNLPAFSNSGTAFWWTTGAVWNNSSR